MLWYYVCGWRGGRVNDLKMNSTTITLDTIHFLIVITYNIYHIYRTFVLHNYFIYNIPKQVLHACVFKYFSYVVRVRHIGSLRSARPVITHLDFRRVTWVLTFLRIYWVFVFNNFVHKQCSAKPLGLCSCIYISYKVLVVHWISWEFRSTQV